MLNLSGKSIPLIKSTHFIRLTLVLHSFAIFMVWCTSLTIYLKASIAFYLAYRLYDILFKPKVAQYLPFEKIDFQAKKWIVHNKEGSALVYDKIAVILEAGVFFLLELSNTQDSSNRITRKVVMIFFDQITKEDYRILRLLEKIS